VHTSQGNAVSGTTLRAKKIKEDSPATTLTVRIISETS